MRFARSTSFRQRVANAIVGIAALSLAISNITFLVHDWVTFHSALERQAVSIARAVGVNCEAALVFGDERAAEEVLDQFSGRPLVASAALFDREGALMASYLTGGPGGSVPPPMVETGVEHSNRYITVSETILVAGEPTGTISIRMATSEMNQRLMARTVLSAIVLVLGTAAAWILSKVIRLRLTRPVAELAAASIRVSVEEDFSVRVPGSDMDEFADLTRAFNGMLEHIQSRDAALREYQEQLQERVTQLQAEIQVRRETQERLKEREQQLLHSQKMEAIGLLAGGVAHDFNNILTAIQGYGQLLKHDLPSEGRGQERLDEILNSADRAAGLTRQLLAFSRRQILEPEILRLDEVVDQMQKMLWRLLGEQVVLETRIADGVPTIRADRSQLEQIVMNLAINSRDALPAGGVVRVEVDSVEIDAPTLDADTELPPGRYAVLTVTDNGVGMDSATMRRVFEPFFTTKGLGKGTGLGLATVYGIVRQSSGFISVDSRPGEGCRFRIHFPMAVADPEERPMQCESEEIPAEDGRGAVILLVEDEEPVRDSLQEVLTEAGFQVVSAASAEEALGRVPSVEGIDLLLSDVVMPGMNGIELAERIRESRPGTAVLLMSGYAESGLITRRQALQRSTFLHKPFSHKLLLSRIRMLLGPARNAA